MCCNCKFFVLQQGSHQGFVMQHLKWLMQLCMSALNLHFGSTMSDNMLIMFFNKILQKIIPPQLSEATSVHFVIGKHKEWRTERHG